MSKANVSRFVNAFLKEVSARRDNKGFWNLAGTVLAAGALAEFEQFDSQAKAKKNVKTAIERVAARLGNQQSAANATSTLKS
jgi:DNA topoisomerase I